MTAMLKQESFSVDRGLSDLLWPVICSWWEGYNMAPPHKDMMPPDSTLVIYYDGLPVAAIAVILTNTKTAWLENLISDPKSDLEIKKECVDVLINSAISLCEGLGFQRIFCMSNNRATQRRYEQFEFVKTVDVSGMIRRI